MEFMSAVSLPPGFGFHPTDVELISHYLKRKILGLKFEFEVIPEVDIYKHEPWDLPAKSQIAARDCKWHFFTSRDRKYPNGSRSNRATGAGYWKSTGKDRNIRFNNCVIGTKKTLVFHEGRPPYGKRTDWIMHEYYLNENECKMARSKDIFVLCRVTKRNGLTKEDKEVMSTQVEKITACVSLSSNNGPKGLEDVSGRMKIKEEACSPGENMDDIEAWLTELYDPNFCTDPLTEPGNENKVDKGSHAVKQDLEEKHLEQTCVSVPEKHGFYVVPGYQFNASEFDDNMFGLSNSEPADGSYILQSEPGLGLDYLSHPGYGYEDDALIALLDNNGGVVPEDSEESVATLSNFTGHQGTWVDTGIQIRECQARPPNEIPGHRIRLQVHKMESRHVGSVNQTFTFVSQDSHLDSECELNQDSLSFETKDCPNPSGVSTHSHQMRNQLQEKLTHQKPSSAPTSGLGIKSRESASENDKPQGSPSKADYELGSVYASILSIPCCRKKVEPCNPRKSALKCRETDSQAREFLEGIGPLLRKCSSAGLNCLFLVACMVGTAMLIATFLVRDARRFLGSFPAFGP